MSKLHSFGKDVSSTSSAPRFLSIPLTIIYIKIPAVSTGSSAFFRNVLRRFKNRVLALTRQSRAVPMVDPLGPVCKGTSGVPQTKMKIGRSANISRFIELEDLKTGIRALPCRFMSRVTERGKGATALPFSVLPRMGMNGDILVNLAREFRAQGAQEQRRIGSAWGHCS